MALHIFNLSPSHTEAFQDCLNALRPSDCLILIDDGIYALQWALSEAQKNKLKELNVHFLDESLSNRGLDIAHYKADGCNITDYDGFVELCEEHSPVVSW